MKCEFCGKEIKGRKRRYCNLRCNRLHYYQRNKQRISEYRKGKNYDFCKCGNKKYKISKRCWKCHASNKIKGQLSRSTLK